MNTSKQLWGNEEELAIEGQLETLFALQDKTLGKEKKSIWMNEIRNSGIPAKAILRGLEQLKTEEIPNLRFATVCTAARKYVEPDNRESARCEDCNGRGIILMRTPDRYQCALACRCANGGISGGGLKQWNGQEMQMSNGRLLTMA
jgi:hypothetical protein